MNNKTKSQEKSQEQPAKIFNVEKSKENSYIENWVELSIDPRNLIVSPLRVEWVQAEFLGFLDICQDMQLVVADQEGHNHPYDMFKTMLTGTQKHGTNPGGAFPTNKDSTSWKNDTYRWMKSLWLGYAKHPDRLGSIALAEKHVPSWMDKLKHTSDWKKVVTQLYNEEEEEEELPEVEITRVSPPRTSSPQQQYSPTKPIGEALKNLKRSREEKEMAEIFEIPSQPKRKAIKKTTQDTPNTKPPRVCTEETIKRMNSVKLEKWIQKNADHKLYTLALSVYYNRLDNPRKPKKQQQKSPSPSRSPSRSNSPSKKPEIISLL